VPKVVPPPNANLEASQQHACSHRTVTCGCPCCGKTGLRPFYHVERVPASSCALLESYDAAIAFPHGRLELAFCRACGFIANTRYDANLTNDSPHFEETQHCSDCFSSFAHRLASRWVEQYGLREKTILEIGSGQGEFLDLLCTLGNNRGIGFDPAIPRQSTLPEANPRVRFVRDYYSDKYRDETADAICCRHTLEHINQPNKLIKAIRHNMGNRRDVAVLFELPDATRVLQECAFWDIYYEHCSYFTAGSLARLFRRNGFELLELKREFDNQYLLLVARPSEKPSSPQFELEDDLAETAADVAQFQNRHAELIEQWRRRIGQFANNGQRTVIWGGGSKGVAFLTTLGIRSEIDCVIDINPQKHGKFMPGTGHRVVGPDSLESQRPDVVIVMNPIYQSEIQSTLTRKGLSPQLLTV
jgi:SAM-dependent methyltransferase